MARSWRRPSVSSIGHSPKEVLASCGVTPDDVQTVFITHAHFDHLGGTDDFPNATFYIQEQELSKWVWAMSLPPQFKWLMVATDPGDIMRTVDLARQGRLRLINGDRADVLPNIDVYAAMDTHTWGCMYVVVRNDGKSLSDDAWILAGDLVYCFENLRGRVAGEVTYLPVGMATGSQTNLLLTTDKMLALVGRESKRVIPIHEEGLRDVFPSRITEAGLRITELCLADGESSRVS
jgi:N-acyl homoserine lactone hydrolase